MSLVLAIDAGTTGVRAVVFEGTTARGAAYQELLTSFPQPGRAEQDGEGVWNATRAVVAQALAAAGAKAGELAAVGIANQRSSVIAWDRDTLAPLAPMILWHDVRAVERADELVENGFFVTASMAVTKAEWLLRNVDDVAVAAAAGRLRLGGMESWLAARLSGGAHVCDHANGSATGFYEHFERTWDGALLAALSIDEVCMPQLVDSCGVVAETSAESIGARVPIAAMCADQQASLYGLGCHAAGQTKCSYGTSAMVDASTGETLMLGGTGTYPLIAWSVDGVPSYCVEGSVLSAGAAVQWLRDGAGMVADAAESGVLAASVADSGGVWAVPAFQGLGTPRMEAGARALIGGLSRGSTRAHIVRAILEGIAHRVADAAAAVWEAVEPPPTLRADGGASRNDFLMQTQADVLGVPVERSAVSDGAALGAAALAARAVGAWDDGDVAHWRGDVTFEPRLTTDARERARSLWQDRVRLAGEGLA